KIDVGAGVFKLAVKRAVPAYEGVCGLEYFGTPPVEDGQVELIERGIDDGSVDVVVPIMIWRKGVRKKDTEGAFFRADTDGVPCSAAGFIGHLQPVLSGRDDGCGRAGAAVRPLVLTPCTDRIQLQRELAFGTYFRRRIQEVFRILRDGEDAGGIRRGATILVRDRDPVGAGLAGHKGGTG